MKKLQWNRENFNAWKDKFTDYWERHGFAVVLLFCAGIIGVTALFGERLRYWDQAEATVPPAATRLAVMAARQDNETESAFDLTLETPAPPAEMPKKPMMIWPASGEIAVEYHADSLHYNETLNEYTTHPAIDILVPQGTDILCAMDGIVESAYVDTKLGNVVILSHENGLRTGYASLNRLDGIQPGMAARQGMVLAGVGDTAASEQALGTHLHFFVLDAEGNPIDPLLFFS